MEQRQRPGRAGLALAAATHRPLDAVNVERHYRMWRQFPTKQLHKTDRQEPLRTAADNCAGG
jgi:hypothetical protein